VRAHVDDRRAFFGDLFDLATGDVNVVVLLPGSVCAWHRHAEQDDQLFCAKGTVRVGMKSKAECQPNEITWEVLDERNPRVITVPRGLYHGYQNLGPERAILVGYNNRKYDGSDEERLMCLEGDWQRAPR
jgi:dTDP-4-dehydrorhamnose 3,5-epimerase-like enzyme